MKPLRHPVSALLLDEPRAYAPAGVLRMLLRAGGGVSVLYAGDRMWPAVRHGTRLALEPAEPEQIRVGDAIVAISEGVPDLLRVVGMRPGGWELRGDADPGPSVRVAHDALVARTSPAAVPRSWGTPTLRRLALELAEAWSGWSFEDGAATSVLRKYDAQAPYYASHDEAKLDERLLSRIRTVVRPGGRILVAGSGAGHEAFGLAHAGWSVVGVDFAPRMVELAREGAQRRGLAVEFAHGDLRTHDEPRESLGAVLFTYDVYSFVPEAKDRVAILCRMRDWLEPTGAIFLSARTVRRPYDRGVLTVEWLGRRTRGRASWGDSHTRYIAADGSLCRSFVHYFTRTRLRRELGLANLRPAETAGGHMELRIARRRDRP